MSLAPRECIVHRVADVRQMISGEVRDEGGTIPPLRI